MLRRSGNKTLNAETWSEWSRKDAQARPRQSTETWAIPHRLLAGRVQIGPDARGRKHRAVDLRDGRAGREVLHGVARRPFPGFDDRDAGLHPHVRLDRRAADLSITCRSQRMVVS